MATDKSMGREHRRQHGSEMMQGSVQQGSNPASADAPRQSTAWQDPAARGGESQSSSAALQRPGGSYAAQPYSGAGAFSMLRRLNEDMERLFDSFGFGRNLFPEPAAWHGLGRGEPGASFWSPRVEICEREGKLIIAADLPGLKKEDVKVEIDRDAVTIQGERKQEEIENERGYYRSERSYGSFYRTIPLPEGADPQTASATFRDGVLHIEMKAPQTASTARTLEIKDAASAATSHGAGAESKQMAGGTAQKQR